MEDLSSGLSRLHKLKGLAEKSEKKETEGKENEKDAKEFKKVEDALSVLDKISSFQKGFESEEESEEEVDDDDDEDDKSMMTKLDLSSVRIEQEGSQMYPSNESNIDPSAASFMKKVNVAADTEEKDASIVPIKIRSVGEARRQHRERIKASETQILVRHARHVAAKAVVDTSYEEKKKAKKKKKKMAESKRHVEEKSSIDYLEEDDNAPVNEYEGVILLSDLRYTEFSSNYIMRGDLIKQCGDLLQSRSTVVLRTVTGEDALDAKMMLRTIATELAMYHASEFIIPEIKYDTVSGTTEMRLDPK